MELKHSPGPWNRNIKPARKYATIFSGRNQHVCHLAPQGMTDEEIEANCDLITTAPELLTALIVLRQRHQIDESHHADLCEFCQLADAAIAKATGRPA